MTDPLLENEQLRELVESVVGALLGMSVLRADNQPELDRSVLFEVNVPIQGESASVVQLHTTEGFARRATATMFRLPVSSVSPEDIRDSLSEIGNILGGNIKGILPGVNSLGLPLVSRSTNRTAQLPDPIIAGSFLCDGEPFELELIVAGESEE
jgi:chemotaxis protein CheX